MGERDALHFGELPACASQDIKTLKRIAPAASAEKGEHDGEGLPANAWQVFSQVVVPISKLDKPRLGAQLSEYNHERFEDLVSAGWDLVIVDGRRLGGSTDQVAPVQAGPGTARGSAVFAAALGDAHQGRPTPFTGWCR